MASSINALLKEKRGLSVDKADSCPSWAITWEDRNDR